MRHKISKVTPLSLVSPSRLDVFCRLEFVRDEITKVGRSWGKQLYKEFIYKSSLDKNELEAWGEDGIKWSYTDYEDSFKSLVYSIKKNGYDNSNHPIPVSESIPTNGAHRLAIAISLNLVDISVKESL